MYAFFVFWTDIDGCSAKQTPKIISGKVTPDRSMKSQTFAVSRAMSS